MTENAKAVLDMQEKQFKMSLTWIKLLRSEFLDPTDNAKAIENYCSLLIQITELQLSAIGIHHTEELLSHD